MVEKPTIQGYYRFRFGNNWFIDRFEEVDSFLLTESGSVEFKDMDEIHGPIDPRPDAPATATPPDEVEALAEKLYIEIIRDRAGEPLSSLPQVLESAFDRASDFIEFRNARRDEKAARGACGL